MIPVLIVVVMLAVIGGIWYWHTNRNDPRSHHIVLLDGFPMVHIPVSHSRPDAESLSQALQATYNESWDEMSTVYAVKPRPAQIAVIGTTDGIVHKSHPHVLWIAPRDKVFLRVQDEMFYWFARELHNIFRYQLFGMEWIYKSRNKDDGDRLVAIEKWIDLRYGI